MNFAPSGLPHWKRYLKIEKLTPKLVKKKIHGQMVWVKVYPPRWECVDDELETHNQKFSGKMQIETQKYRKSLYTKKHG